MSGQLDYENYDGCGACGGELFEMDAGRKSIVCSACGQKLCDAPTKIVIGNAQCIYGKTDE